MPMFRKDPEKAARAAAAAAASAAEAARLKAISRVDLAVELLPGLGLSGTTRVAGQWGVPVRRLISWQMRPFSPFYQYSELFDAFTEAIKLLVNANLVERRIEENQVHWCATGAGEDAIRQRSAKDILTRPEIF